LLFSLLPTQLEELEKVQDARDMDILLTKILEAAEEAPLFEGRSGCSYAQQGVFLVGGYSQGLRSADKNDRGT